MYDMALCLIGVVCTRSLLVHPKKCSTIMDPLRKERTILWVIKNRKEIVKLKTEWKELEETPVSEVSSLLVA